jgi:hypothetical protein
MNILKILIILILLVVVVLGYLGFVPVVSELMGSTKPKDLGVTYSSADLDRYVEKAGIKFEPLDAALGVKESLRFEGKKDLDVSFTSEEITAMVNSDKWKYYPVSDVQIKINSDGTAEASGVLRKDRLMGYLEAQRIPTDQVNAIMDYIKDIPLNPIFYIKGTGKVVDNKVDMEIQKAEIGRLSIPQQFIDDESPVEGFVESRISFVPNFYIEKFDFDNGKMNFKGTYPEVQYNVER